jgi:acetyl esterase
MMKSHQPALSGAAKATTPLWVDKQIQLALKKPLDVRFYGRRSSKGTSPLVVHFHAGAFVGGSLEGGSCVAGLLADAGAVVMSLDYPLAPEHPFPAPLKWATPHWCGPSSPAPSWLAPARRSLSPVKKPAATSPQPWR